MRRNWKWLSPLSLLALMGLAFLIFGVRSAKPDAGHEVVLVHKPVLFGHGGVDPTPVKTGRTYVLWTTDRVDVNMQPQQFTEHFDDLMSADGVPLDFDSAIRTKVTNSVKLIEAFGPAWYKNNVSAVFRNLVRQAVRKHGMNETAIDTTAIDKIDTEVSEAMSKYITETGLPIKLIDITIGKANPPDSIKSQRVETAAQQQRSLTEGQKKLAEDARKQAEESRAAADNAYRNAMQMHPDQFIELERLKMLANVCSHGGCTFIIGQTGGIVPVLKTETNSPPPEQPKK